MKRAWFSVLFAAAIVVSGFDGWGQRSVLAGELSPAADAGPAPRGPLPSAADTARVPTKSGVPSPSDMTASLSCNACHTTAAWKTRGETSQEGGGFDHSKTGFPLTGQHTRAACVSCHVADRPTPSRECVSCHADWHRGRLGTSCDRCHSAAGWKVTRPIEIHRFTRFPLTGMHVLADCTECHRRSNEHLWVGAPVDCFSCHEKDYRNPSLRPSHQGSATSQPFSRDCSLCHRAVAWAPAFIPAGAVGIAGSPLTAVGAQAAPAGHDLRFPISFGSHRAAACSDCHVSPASPRSVRCVGCHAHDPTRIVLQHKQPVATQGSFCIACHIGGARR